ncbi:MAG TPA: PilZ domain-containing protein [Sediminispirochaeta sp.]|nr:PilZ domain-containing protein [Sediminispirochaeta sp.]
MGNIQDVGRKIFFLYPHSVIQEELVEHIIRNEYEVYLVNDHQRLIPILQKYPDSILFINIDERMKEPDWERYIKSLMNSEKTKGVQIGILTYNEDKELARKYLMDLMVPGGYIQLKLGLKESTKIILKTLQVHEAKGKRRFVRARCSANIPTEFNVELFGKMHDGYVHDISTAGMACRFRQDIDLPVKTELNRMQLKLRSRIVMVSGIIAGRRNTEEGTIYVVIFTDYISSQAKDRISNFVYYTLQAELKKEMDKVNVG